MSSGRRPRSLLFQNGLIADDVCSGTCLRLPIVTVFREPMARVRSAYLYCLRAHRDTPTCGFDNKDQRRPGWFSELDVCSFADSWGSFSFAQLARLPFDEESKHEEHGEKTTIASLSGSHTMHRNFLVEECLNTRSPSSPYQLFLGGWIHKFRSCGQRPTQPELAKGAGDVEAC
jgi:hypothetical protein